MGTEEFLALVRPWITTAKAPRFDRLYTDLVYDPMLEVMKYLREKDYRTYIVTGGGQEFVRVYSDSTYGVPPERVVGSSIVTKYDNSGGKPVLMREPKPFFIDDGPGKAIGINMFIGKRPYAAITTMPRASMPTGPEEVFPILTLADFPMNCFPRPTRTAGS